MSITRIGIVGGTGEQGRGLARRFGLAGLAVLIGSRDAAKAADVAAALNVSGVTGTSNEGAVAGVDAVIIAVPWSAHAETITELAPLLAGKIVIDCVNPLGFDGQGAFSLPVAEGSACQQAQALLADARVVGAFHHISAVLLLDEAVEVIDGDVLVVGDDREATDAVQELVTKIPRLRGVYGGRLRNAGQVEAFTANLISINRRYKAHAGLAITDI